MFENILVETHGGVGLVRLNRPEQLNALNSATLNELAQAVRDFEQDEAIGAIVVTGNERAFAAGADILEFQKTSLPELLRGQRADAYEVLRRARKPLVAAVSGYAYGGGCELAMLCDLIVASETARFAQPEVNLGLIPGGGGTQRLTRQVGRYLAMEVILAGRVLSAWEAYKHGLVNRVVPVELYLEEALELAQGMAERAPLAVRLAKDAVNRALEVGLEAGLALERSNFLVAFGSEDKAEGTRAFVEKRKPVWKGR
ncbi:MAG: enoyl-CoA hydratase-related protein [Meiothermus sp.]|uniref:enoyl-CoA hydratase-related protein n=1 Tax=Meiothermus sp. TaxID=1955249 RepID=UPI002600CB3F|nr:enoyl-CoA hydratase-related protein [Meiothermus sp.]MCS7058189.1 enoyl-CoA hydratase-related protein [Meiothermus sp.]MCS7194433.1 enoyl-CoA hydratase-related protein [Meiothermus sp.]MCX7739449.1 enoyl-CoA hydratase-related protein [Meiothermus sp.]MDW8091087.1 enoyl-CoA hydratase-related protein [Meiothermus sp.]MDW8481378.1 enoyl-CoA hydratase-related protein [Meiothermus sp.]